MSLSRYDYTGTTTADVDQRTVGDPVVEVPAAFLRVTSTPDTTLSDATGGFTFVGTGGPRSVTAMLRGAYVTVANLGGSNATFGGTLVDGQPLPIHFSAANSVPAERDAFRAVTTTNRFVSTVFPSVAWIDTPVGASVELNQTCNAYWDGSSINLFRAGGGCNDTGRIFDVVAHEWGHGLDSNAPGGAQDGGLGEFIGDLVAFTQTDSPLIGPAFLTTGGAARDLQNPAYDCYDPSKTEVHDAGQLLGEVVWDIHEDLESAGVTGEALKREMLLPIGGAQTRSQWYNGMLVVDDDDGNLANGTPHECLIYNQFKLHSCGGTRWPGIPASDPPACLPPVPTTTSVLSSNNPSARFTSVTFTATVTSLDAGATPDGSIVFRDGTTVRATTPVVAGPPGTSAASYSTTTLLVGAHAITASYVPTTNHTASDGTLTQNVYCPIDAITATPDVLSPADGRMVTVTIVAASACNTTTATRECTITSVSSNEPVTGRRDWIIVGPRQVRLHAENEPGGPGRTYDLTVTCAEATPTVHHAFVNVPPGT